MSLANFFLLPSYLIVWYFLVLIRNSATKNRRNSKNLNQEKKKQACCAVGRGHIDQIRARLSRRLFLKSIYPMHFRNSLVPPYNEKSDFFLQMLILIAQKKRLGALNATQKIISPCQIPLLRKSRKTSKNANFPQKCMLVVLLHFLSNGTWQRPMVFVLRSVHKVLLSYQNQHSERKKSDFSL